MGSTVLTTGVSGSKKYHAYGGGRGGSVPSEWQYTGQELDGGTGLVYLHARYYDPATGQFLSPDTLVPDPTNLLSYNRYMYGYGNPVKYADPSGHCALSLASPAFVAVDAACWSTPVGPVVAAGVAGGVAGVAIGVVAIQAFNEPPLSYPPPTRALDAAFPTESFPLGNTVSSGVIGIPVGDLDPTGAAADTALPESGSTVWSEPLAQEATLADSIYFSNILRKNMEAAGLEAPAGWAAHHIVPAAAKAGRDARRILQEAEIDINDPANGVFLPQNPSVVDAGGATIHSSMHTNAYYARLAERLSAANGREEVLNVLDAVRQELLQGISPH